MVFFAEEFEALARDFHADLLEFGPLERQDAGGELFVHGQLVGHFVAGRDDPALDHFGIRCDEGEDEFIAVDAGLGDDLCVGAKRIGFIEHVAVREPLLVAVFSPFRQILLGNGGSVEELVDDPHDFGFGIEPFDELVSRVAVVDAIVEFVPDFSREVGDC